MAMPPEPLSELQAGAVQMHEIFTAYTNAGFSRLEALELVKEVLRAGLQQHMGGDQAA